MWWWWQYVRVLELKIFTLLGKIAASQRISENYGFFHISSSPVGCEQISLCCYWPAELQLSVGLWCVQEDGAVGGEDLPGLGGGQLASGPHQAHAISFPQGQDHTEGHRTSTAAVTTGWASIMTSHRPCWALQLLDAAVRHGQDGLYTVTLLCCQQSWNQVSAIHWNSKDPCLGTVVSTIID